MKNLYHIIVCIFLISFSSCDINKKEIENSSKTKEIKSITENYLKLPKTKTKKEKSVVKSQKSTQNSFLDTNSIQLAVYLFHDVITGTLIVKRGDSNQLNHVMSQLSISALLDLEKEIREENRNTDKFKKILYQHLLDRSISDDQRSYVNYRLAGLIQKDFKPYYGANPIDVYKECIKLGEEGKSTKYYMPALGSLAKFYRDNVKNYKESRTYYKKYKELAREWKFDDAVYQADTELALIDINDAVATKNKILLDEAINKLEGLASEENKKYPFYPYAKSRLENARKANETLTTQ